jgi:heme-degrading monooxygenase HmoA
MEGAMAGVMTVTFELNLKPEMTEKFISEWVSAVPGTRTFPGCLRANLYRNSTDPNKVLMSSDWASKEDYDKYIIWRKETGNGSSWIDSLVSEYLAWKAGNKSNIHSVGWQTRPSEPEYWYREEA